MKVSEVVRTLLAVIFACSLSLMSQAQVSWDIGQEVDDVMDLLFEYTYPELAGKCHACVFRSDISVYIRQSPVCLFEWESQVYNIAEDVERFTCFNEDPRALEDIDCRTLLSNDTFDCYSCQGNPSIKEASKVTLQSDFRCSYKVELWDKGAVRTLLFEDLG